MKRELFFTFWAVVLLLPLTAQQITLSGRVSIHNSKYRTGTIEYVKDAYVSAPFAGSAASDSEGRFGLDFVGMDAGTQVKLTAEKAGLEVVNGYELERVTIGQKSPLRIFLAEKGRLAQAQTELYNISKKALYAKKDALIARLLGNEKESQAALAALEKDLGIEIGSPAEAIELLDSKIESLEKRLPEFAQELASKNLDFASELYIQAYEFYEAGEIEKAIAVLDDAQLEQSYQDAMATVAKGKKLEKVGQELQEKGLLQVDQIVDSYELKAEAYNLLFEYRNAVNVYEKIIKILEETKEEEDIELADAYDEIGGIYRDLGEYSTALFYRKKNVKIKEQQLEETDPDLATSYNNLALIYQDLGDYEKALAAQQKALGIREQVLEANHPSIATSYHNMVNLLYYQNDLDSALYYEQKAYAIWKEKLPDGHPNLATAEANFAFLYEKRGQRLQGKGKYQEALQDFQHALEYSAEEAELYNRVGLCYYFQKDYTKAIEHYEKSREAGFKDERIYLNNSGMAYAKLGQFEAAKAQFEQLEELIPEEGLLYRDWAAYYALKDEPEKALDNLEKAIELGYNNWQWIETDDSLDGLRTHPRCQQLLERKKE